MQSEIKHNTANQRQIKQLHTKKHRVFPLFIALLVLLTSMSLSGCDSEIKHDKGYADDLDYKEETIEIVGLTDENFTVSVSELAALECIEKEVTTKNSYGSKKTKTAYGPLLQTFVEEYGMKLSDFSNIRIKAKDGYFTDLEGDLLKRDSVLSFRDDAESPLKGASAPLILIVPKESSAMWVEGINKIEFEK